MLGRLPPDISSTSLMKEGEIIRLDCTLYTELTHRVNETTTPAPAVVILKYSAIGYQPNPLVEKVHDPISCTTFDLTHATNPLRQLMQTDQTAQ